MKNRLEIYIRYKYVFNVNVSIPNAIIGINCDGVVDINQVVRNTIKLKELSKTLNVHRSPRYFGKGVTNITRNVTFYLNFYYVFVNEKVVRFLRSCLSEYFVKIANLSEKVP